jgi:uncharacterized membrane protein
MTSRSPVASIDARPTGGIVKAASTWLIPAGLLGLAAIPVVAGSLRLGEMAGGPALVPDGERVLASPAALATHIVTVTLFGVLGAFQFAPGLRRRRRGLHRIMGRVVIPAGLISAWSGLWLTFSLAPTEVDSTALSAVRVLVVAFMTAALVLGFRAVLRRDLTEHRAWMIRGYAIGMAAGTQAFTLGAWQSVAGTMTASSRFSMMLLAWLLNAAAAELIIRRRTTPAQRTPPLRVH